MIEVSKVPLTGHLDGQPGGAPDRAPRSSESTELGRSRGAPGAAARSGWAIRPSSLLSGPGGVPSGAPPRRAGRPGALCVTRHTPACDQKSATENLLWH
jgi:hypothetical protein